MSILERCPGEDCNAAGRRIRNEEGVYQCTSSECRVTTFVGEEDRDGTQ